MKLSNTLSLAFFASATQLITIAHAANCYSGPKWEYDSNTYTNSWAVRSSLCSKSASESCRTIGISTVCEFQSGNVYGAFRAASQDEAMAICWDAFNNIINQCVYSNQPGGFYTYNDMSFSLQPVIIGASNN